MSGVSKSAARAVADLSAGTVLATVEIAATPERVFAAISTDEIATWWGAPDLYRTTQWIGDVRPGGRWRATGENADGTAFSVEGEFREVDPPRKLVQTWCAPWDGGNETTLTYRLEPIDGGTRVTVQHAGFGSRRESCEGHSVGWERVLAWLAKHFASAPEPLQYFFCRLLSPRPTFAQDMTPEEAALMREHVAYWNDLRNRGTAVVFGPIADPAGVWGMGVVRVTGRPQMDALREGDPVMRSGKGFRYEILPMLRAVARD